MNEKITAEGFWAAKPHGLGVEITHSFQIFLSPKLDVADELFECV